MTPANRRITSRTGVLIAPAGSRRRTPLATIGTLQTSPAKCFGSGGVTQSVGRIIDIPIELRAHARAEVRRIASRRLMSASAA